ncbi:MAG: hypothetical protein JSS89_13230 [Bacteroidetes bacterium]|nr:hypothetical protein [Bacteroidota bacterium]
MKSYYHIRNSSNASAFDARELNALIDKGYRIVRVYNDAEGDLIVEIDARQKLEEKYLLNAPGTCNCCGR